MLWTRFNWAIWSAKSTSLKKCFCFKMSTILENPAYKEGKDWDWKRFTKGNNCFSKSPIQEIANYLYCMSDSSEYLS